MVVCLVRSPIKKAVVILISTNTIEQYESAKKEKEKIANNAAVQQRFAEPKSPKSTALILQTLFFGKSKGLENE